VLFDDELDVGRLVTALQQETVGTRADGVVEVGLDVEHVRAFT
jgi:hypothetical protein